MSRTIHILYENAAWLPPLTAALEAEGLEHQLHEVWHGVVDPGTRAPDGIWLNRMSPSSHTRGHGESVALMREILAWVEGSGRTVVNGSHAFEIEVSKMRQDMVLRRHGIAAPRTVLTVGREHMLAVARTFEGPFLTKHNQGGKGLGISIFQHPDELPRHLDDPTFDPGPNGQIVLQEYITPREPFITRVELVGGRFLYAMRSSTVGGFELCPADSCAIERSNQAPDVCPADGSGTFTASPMTREDPLVEQYLHMCAAEGYSIAGIEYVEDAKGRRFTYDINGNTNYNSAVGASVGVDGMREIARWLKTLS
jgi:hypothetical protein